MAHLIETIRNSSLGEAILELERTHELIVYAAISAQNEIGSKINTWGSDLKRLEVVLPQGQLLLGKSTEKLVELINILATTERTISALKWFETLYPNAFLRECHSSTSDDTGGNDIVLIEPKSEKVIVRCEVTDVTSSNPGQNGKEKKDLKNLGCSYALPSDGVDRYIATSLEFSNALKSEKRKWKSLHYRYFAHETKCSNQTVMLEIVSA
ncbi:hypothetical protein ACJJIW_17180 [Microbulbifer sp. JMSA004]|uniref:hypothetical protein n=1 Tax=Microbulbifer sp. JMSA004 TaxID=3243370 RepID=UPI00403A22CE